MHWWFLSDPASGVDAVRDQFRSAGSGPDGSPWTLDMDLSFTAHEELVSAMTVCAREQFLCTGSRDSTVRCWRLRNNSRPSVERTYNGHRRSILSLHTLATGGGGVAQRIASCDGAVDVWDIEKGTRLIHYSPHISAGGSASSHGDIFSGGAVANRLFTATLALPGDTQLACAAGGRIVTYDLRSPSRRHGMEWWVSQSSNTCGRIHSISTVGGYMLAAGISGAALVDARMGIVVQRWSMPSTYWFCDN